ncbi:unnamed protein product, partial [marine sediment metagenome]
MKKTTTILAVTLVIAGLVITTAANIPATETTTTNAS